ncbi:MAG TPA: amidohydrolase family protein [Burkholderiales bacterium]|nr:amidohydrolase family protein [Burkholderiales bacterium]
MSVIDIHPHIISPDEKRYPRAGLGGKQSDWSRERPVSAEEMLKAMDEAGIERSVLVQASTCYGHDNSYVADAVAAHPDRFAGVFSVDMLAADAPQRIRYWRDKGLDGLRVFIAGHTASHDVRLDDPRSFPAWLTATELNLPVCLQCRAPHLPQVETLLKEFPRARIILDHMARPDPDNAESLFALARYPNLLLKYTTHNVRDAAKSKTSPEAFMTRVVQGFGAARIAWGSNYPASDGSLRSLTADARRALGLVPEGDCASIFGGTAQTLY